MPENKELILQPWNLKWNVKRYNSFYTPWCCDESYQKFRLSQYNPPKFRRKEEHHRTDEYLGGNTAPEFDEDIVCYYRKIYYEALDCITNAVANRFDQQDFKVYIKLENVLYFYNLDPGPGLGPWTRILDPDPGP